MAVLVLSCGPAFAQTTYSGRSVGLYVDTARLGPISLSDTGALASTGGARSASLLQASVPNVASAGVLVACTSGGSGRADGNAGLVNLSVLPGSATALTASLVRASSHADCNGVRGGSEILGLTFCGKQITVTGEPNQKVSVAGATLVINEQKTTASGAYRKIEVNALHLTVLGVAEVIVSHAESDINCGGVALGPCRDFVAGSGKIATVGGEASFGIAGGYLFSDLSLSIDFVYSDLAANVHVQGTSLTAYQALSKTARKLTGKCKINGVDGTFVVEVADEGDGLLDTFKITLSNGYTASGHLTGGDAELHAEVDLKSLTFSSSKVCGGMIGTGKVNLQCIARGGATIHLTSSNPAVASVSAVVEVLAGKSTASFAIQTAKVDVDTQVTISAHYGDQVVSAILTVKKQSLLSLSITPSTICDAIVVVGKVTLSCPAGPGGVVVSLSSSNSAVASCPSSVLVAEGKTSATFAISTVKVSAALDVKITASWNGTVLIKVLKLKAQGVASVTLDPKLVCGGIAVKGKVVINCAAPVGGLVVKLKSSNSLLASCPDSVVVAQGTTSAYFALGTVAVAVDTKVLISASCEGIEKSATLTIRAPLLLSVSCSPLEILGGLKATGKVTIDCPAPAGGLIVHLLSDNGFCKVPSTCTILEGKTECTFDILTSLVGAITQCTIKATCNNVSKSCVLKLLP
jgi:hypothetical protein